MPPQRSSAASESSASRPRASPPAAPPIPHPAHRAAALRSSPASAAVCDNLLRIVANGTPPPAPPARGSSRVIAATCAAVTCRGLRANTNPTASAPNSPPAPHPPDSCSRRFSPTSRRPQLSAETSRPSKLASAAPGSGSRINDSPTRNASNPASTIRAMSAALWMPLSATRSAPRRQPLRQFNLRLRIDLPSYAGCGCSPRSP